MRAKLLLVNVLGVFVGLLVFAAAFQLVSQLMPISEGLSGDYPQKNPFNTFVANRSFVYSTGWKADVSATGRINNFGFPSVRDFAPNPKSVVIIGDSYVEALMVNQSATMPHFIEQSLPKYHAYPLGVSGGSLATYIALAEFAQKEIGPTYGVVLVVSGDVEEAMERRKEHPYFAKTSTGLEMRLPEKTAPSYWRKIAATPRLTQYVLRNLHFSVEKVLPKSKVESEIENSTNTTDYFPAIEFFLARLPGSLGIPPSRIAIVLDSDRKSMGTGNFGTSASSVAPDRYATTKCLLARRAIDLGYKVIDTDPLFRSYTEQSKMRVDFLPVDYHWNGTAHQIVGRQIGLWIESADAQQDFSARTNPSNQSSEKKLFQCP